MADFLLPDLGEGLTEAEIVSWRVQVGDLVDIDQIVVEVETAKASVEVPIPFAGVVSVLHAGSGETVAVGTPLISVSTEQSPAAVGFREPGIVVAEVEAGAAADPVSGNVLIGYGTPSPTGRRRRGSRATPAAGPEPVAVTMTGASTPAGTAPAVISPLVRRIARDASIDVGTVTGSGPAGLVLRRDVEQAIAQAAPRATGAAGPHSPVEPTAQEDRRIPLTGLRRAVADKLSRSRREIPEATVWVDADATGLIAARARLNALDPDRPVGLLALLARFAIVGLRRHPELNGRVEADDIVLSSAVNLGFAAQTPRGLVVPVVRHAERLTTRELSAAIGRHTASARAGTLRPGDLTGGSFTVNNYGVFGVDGSAAIINHPEVAILGIGRIIDKPWVLDGALAVRKVTQLTLAFDHRVCDGGTAGGFLRFVADCVEAPVVVLGEL